MPDEFDPSNVEIDTAYPSCGATININVDFQQNSNLFRVATGPYRSLLERLYAAGRITDEEVQALNRELEDLRRLVKYGYEDGAQSDGSTPSGPV